MLFFGIEYVYGCPVHGLLFQYVIDNWNWYFGIGIFEVKVELVCVIGVELELI